MVCDPINLSVLWRPWKEMSSWETQLELRMARFLQYFIIKILSILNDEWFSIGIQNTAKFKMQGNLYCGEGSHLRDREAVRQRDSICLHFTLTDWKQAGFPETWLWKHPRGSLRRLGPSNFPQKYIFALSGLWMCRAVAFCKQEGSNSENWPCFPHPWAQCKHTLLQEPYYAHTSYLWFQLCFLSPSSSFFPYSASPEEPLQTCWRRWFGTISEEPSCQRHRPVEIILGKSCFWEQWSYWSKASYWMQFHSWPAVAESTIFPTEVLGAILSTLSWSTETPECTRKALSSAVVRHTFTQTPLFPKTLVTTLSLGFLLLKNSFWKRPMSL